MKKCHKAITWRIAGLKDCLGKECSLWNGERNECTEKSYYEAWGKLYAIQVGAMNMLDKLDEHMEAHLAEEEEEDDNQST